MTWHGDGRRSGRGRFGGGNGLLRNRRRRWAAGCEGAVLKVDRFKTESNGVERSIYLSQFLLDLLLLLQRLDERGFQAIRVLRFQTFLHVVSDTLFANDCFA